VKIFELNFRKYYNTLTNLTADKINGVEDFTIISKVLFTKIAISINDKKTLQNFCRVRV